MAGKSARAVRFPLPVMAILIIGAALLIREGAPFELKKPKRELAVAPPDLTGLTVEPPSDQQVPVASADSIDLPPLPVQSALAKEVSPSTVEEVVARLRKAIYNGAVYSLSFSILSKLTSPTDRLQALETLLRDPSGSKQALYCKPHAIHLVGELQDPAGVPLALEFLQAPDPWLRREAAEALGKLGNTAVSGALQVAYEGAPLDTKRVIAAALARLGDPRFVPRVLEEAARDLDHPEPEVREKAIGAVLRLGDPRGFPIALTAIHDPRMEVRRTAVAILAQSRNPEALPYLRSMLTAREGDIRWMAQRGIEEISGTSLQEKK